MVVVKRVYLVIIQVCISLEYKDLKTILKLTVTSIETPQEPLEAFGQLGRTNGLLAHAWIIAGLVGTCQEDEDKN